MTRSQLLASWLLHIVYFNDTENTWCYTDKECWVRGGYATRTDAALAALAHYVAEGGIEQELEYQAYRVERDTGYRVDPCFYCGAAVPVDAECAHC